MNSTHLLAITVALGASSALAQTTLFDFDTAAAHSPLPLTLALNGVSARFSATDQGFAIQPANTMGFTPAGFSGNCLYPNSINRSDLLISFSDTLSALSILYAPQELACDSSATLRITAFLDSTEVGTATQVADPPGTWPSATLAIDVPQGFNNVVIHYDSPPPTGGDYGTIFMADNLSITTIPEPGPQALLGLTLCAAWYWRGGALSRRRGLAHKP